jgi:hypothetical protein
MAELLQQGTSVVCRIFPSAEAVWHTARLHVSSPRRGGGVKGSGEIVELASRVSSFPAPLSSIVLVVFVAGGVRSKGSVARRKGARRRSCYTVLSSTSVNEAIEYVRSSVTALSASASLEVVPRPDGWTSLGPRCKLPRFVMRAHRGGGIALRRTCHART